MKVKKIGKITLATILTLGAVTDISCTSSFISHEISTKIQRKIKTSPLVLGFEGMQPFSGYVIKSLINKIKYDLDHHDNIYK
tara:strand:- start:58 stop:303 length:246 start_codon:yes stop_codon:yes gene_type:complete